MDEKNRLPENTENITVFILDNAQNKYPAKMTIKRWSDPERRRRAWSQSLKIVGILFGCSLLGLFVHPLLLLVGPAWIVLICSFVPLFTKFLGETVTFFGVEGHCAVCQRESHFGPYLDSRLQTEMSVLCSECGQKTRAYLPDENLS